MSGPPGYLPPPQPYQPYPYLGGYYRPDAQGATAAMVLGIIAVCALPLGCCCGLGEFVVLPLGIMAIVFGVGARQRIDASQGALGGGGKAVAGITTGSIAVAIGVVLLIIILLSFGLTSSPIQSFSTPTPSG